MTNKQIIEHVWDDENVFPYKKEDTIAYSQDTDSNACNLCGCVNMLWDTILLLTEENIDLKQVATNLFRAINYTDDLVDTFIQCFRALDKLPAEFSFDKDSPAIFFEDEILYDMMGHALQFTPESESWLKLQGK